MARVRRQQVAVAIPVADTEAALAALRTSPPWWRVSMGVLRSTVRGTRVMARLGGAGGRYSSVPPTFRGRVRDGVLSGRIKEHVNEVMIPRIFFCTSVFCLLVALALLIGDPSSPGVWILGPAGLLFAYFVRALGGARPEYFRTTSAELQERLEEVCRTPSAG